MNTYCIMWVLHCAVCFGNKDTEGKRGVPCTEAFIDVSFSGNICKESQSDSFSRGCHAKILYCSQESIQQ